MVFSRFMHRFERNGVSAWYHSLRMVPVYMPASFAGELSRRIGSGADDKPLDMPWAAYLTRLQDAKIIVPDAAYDGLVLHHIRESIDPPHVEIAYFILSEACNCNCSYCFVKHDMGEGFTPHAMTPEVAHAAIDTYARLIDQQENGKKIVLFGGEPLLNVPVIKDIVKTVEDYKTHKRLPADLGISLLTNGTLLTDELAAYFQKHTVGIGISIDGNEAVNDAVRVFASGGGTYRSIIRGIETAKRHGCGFSVSVTVAETGIEHFDSTMAQIDALGVKEVVVNMLFDNEASDKSGYTEQAADFMLRAYAHLRANGINEERVTRKMNAFTNAQVYPFDCCAAGAKQIIVAPDGAIGICHSQLGTRTDFTGSVFDPAFDPKNDGAFMEWSKRTPLNMPECLPCPALGICGGGCPVAARKKQGSIWNLDERFCVHAKKTLEWLIWDLFEKIKNESKGEKYGIA
ncbi:radical SAM protein [Breznakiellaceae bacterium SP9]